MIGNEDGSMFCRGVASPELLRPVLRSPPYPESQIAGSHQSSHLPVTVPLVPTEQPSNRNPRNHRAEMAGGVQLGLRSRSEACVRIQALYPHSAGEMSRSWQGRNSRLHGWLSDCRGVELRCADYTTERRKGRQRKGSRSSSLAPFAMRRLLSV